jgi:hypothetical protein
MLVGPPKEGEHVAEVVAAIRGVVREEDEDKATLCQTDSAAAPLAGAEGTVRQSDGDDDPPALETPGGDNPFYR